MPAPADPIARPVLDDASVAVLGERGWVSVEGALGAAAATDLLREARRRRADGRLAEAAVGRGARRARRRRVRGDLTCWLAADDPAPALRPLLELFARLQDDANRRAFLGLQTHQVQLACFPGDGAGYLRHRDAFQDGAAARRLTAILYLNPEWRPEHGGCLRLFDETNGHADLEPLLDRLVVLLSDRVEHEVQPAWAERWAATAFFHGPRTLPGT